jgi:putative membrane protein insertion efficiency factor
MLKKIIFTFIKFYRLAISPLFPSSCRFHPTCSQYAIDAIDKYGIVRGILKTSLRILKCHPFHPGGFDPA